MWFSTNIKMQLDEHFVIYSKKPFLTTYIIKVTTLKGQVKCSETISASVVHWFFFISKIYVSNLCLWVLLWDASYTIQAYFNIVDIWDITVKDFSRLFLPINN